jgi:NAD+ kinase
MIVGVYFNKHYLSNNKVYLDKIKKVLTEHKIQCVNVDSFSDLDNLDILMVLGGDGTILMIAAECAKRGIKIIGINYGHVGFLTEFEPDKLDLAIELVCSGDFDIQRRGMLKISYGKNEYYALNDVTIQRSTCGNAFSNTVNLTAEINGSTVDKYSADGLIVSTPTGSTAYSLSAGGSVLTPDLDAFILTPICAHSLHSRPIVFKDSSTLTIRRTDNKGILNLIVDGMVKEEISNFENVVITKSDKYAQFISFGNNNFLNKLLVKLDIWSR